MPSAPRLLVKPCNQIGISAALCTDVAHGEYRSSDLWQVRDPCLARILSANLRHLYLFFFVSIARISLPIRVDCS